MSKLPFDSPYQSFEYMAEMRQYFGEKIAQQIESIPLGEDNDQLNALGMRMLAARVARGESL